MATSRPDRGSADSPKGGPVKDRMALSRAAIEGLVSGLALLACASNRTPSVNAPMEPAGASSARSQGSRPPLPLAVAGHAPKNCCSGKNECKGKSGCRSALNACKGENLCKGKGTSCDYTEGDDDDDDDVTASPSSGANACSGKNNCSGSSGKSNCCSGKNACKGKSGCRTASNKRGPGQNDCKGQGTACPRR